MIIKIINELIHKISELRYSNNQGKRIFGNNDNNKENSLFGNNKTFKSSLFDKYNNIENSTNQENNKIYSPNILNCNYTQYKDLTINNIINQLENNDKKDKDENTVIEIIEEIEEDENINTGSIINQERQNSTTNNSIINIYNELKDKIHKIRIKDENEIINEEIIRIYNTYYQYHQKFKANNICEKCGKITYFFVKNVLWIFAIFAQKIV